MAARPRARSRKGWPAHLYAKERNGPYYFWRHPQTGKEYGLGRDFVRARIESMEANVKLSGMAQEVRLADRISDEGLKTVGDFLPVYLQAVTDRGRKPNTIKTLRSNLKRINEAIGHMVMSRVKVSDLNDKLTEPLTIADKSRQAGQVRSTLIDIWTEAANRGIVETNPAKTLGVKPAKVKRARWTLETFMQAYEAAQTLPDRWVACCMKLALVSAQPRECLVSWEFSDIRDGFLWNERGKTGARIKLPLALTLPGVGWNLGDCLKECRDAVLSRHVLHHNVNRTKAAPGAPVALNGASKGVQRARDLTRLEWPGQLPPTLHEIRSLALRIYGEAHGKDFAQRLAGHKQGTTTDIYMDARGAEWLEVKTK
jgi:integrase